MLYKIKKQIDIFIFIYSYKPNESLNICKIKAYVYKIIFYLFKLVIK